MQKTLGGDRLGSGKKQKVNLHGFNRSTHDLGYLWRSTMAAGTLVPFMKELALPGDTFDINLDCDVKTHPTIGPLFGSYKVQLDIFLAPLRLYNSLLHNNAIGIGLNMKTVLFPVIIPEVDPPTDIIDIDNMQINPSCILSYLGIRGVGTTTETISREFNAIPLLAYWEIYKNYYANKQEGIGAVIHTPVDSLVETVDDLNIAGVVPVYPTEQPRTLDYGGYTMTINFTGATPVLNQIYILTNNYGWLTYEALCVNPIVSGTSIQGTFNWQRWGTLVISSWRYRNDGDLFTGNPQISEFSLGNIDEIRKRILAYTSTTVPFDINSGSALNPYTYLTEDNRFKLNTQEGLGLKTYQSDLFNNWLDTETFDGTGGINELSAVDVSGGTLQMDALNLAKKVYDMLNRIAVSGGTYDDWLDVQYDHNRYTRCESPMYMGGLSKELIFQEVISNSESGGQPLGTLAGKGTMAKKHKGGQITIKVDEPGYIIGIVSLTPRIDYSQGNKWDVHLQNMNDLHVPSLDEIGFQELITEQMAWWSTNWNTTAQRWETKSAGKQPAWINYTTNVNEVRGNFAIQSNEMFMTLNRRYEAQALTDGYEIQDLTTYIDPSKYNNIFAETQLDAQNFWVQIATDITARRKMSARLMPNV